MLRPIWRALRGIFLFAVFIGLVAGFAGIGAAIYMIDVLGQDLPPVTGKRYQPALTSKVYDRNGILLATLHEEEVRARLVPINEIPRITQLAFVAVEDERFFDHYGIDPKAILRAAYKNLRAGGVVEGGSTITQQLAKNRFLKPEKTFERKVQEMILAFKLERTFSKAEILGQYLNEIYFGKGMYGISSAAQFYFGKSVSELGLTESAILAGLPKAPNRYSPFNGTDAYRARMKIVLTKLYEQGYITRGEAMKALSESVEFATPEQARKHAQEKAPYFLAMVKASLQKMYGVRRVYTGGLSVTTTLDWPTQQLAERVFTEAKIFQEKPLEQHPTLQGALVALDAASGDVRALVGGRDFETSQYNRAVQARRQPGSAFKPFVYGTALLQSIAPNTIINDEPIRYENVQTNKSWEPHNFGEIFHGPTILAKALAGSYNIVAVKLLERVGVPSTIELARRLGITTPLDGSLPLALGSSEVTLLEMVGAYAAFANQGIRAEPRILLEVKDYDGRLLHQGEPRETEALDEKTAYIMTQLLRGVVERGTGSAARVPGHVVAGKTGTSNRFVDAWFVGFTPDLALGCFIGDDNRQTLGKGQAGGRVAAPIVGTFLKEYLKDRPARSFHRPPGVDMLAVCVDSGLLPLPECKHRWSLPFTKERAPLVDCNLHRPLELETAGGFSGIELPGGGFVAQQTQFEELPDEEAIGYVEGGPRAGARPLTRAVPEPLEMPSTPAPAAYAPEPDRFEEPGPYAGGETAEDDWTPLPGGTSPDFWDESLSGVHEFDAGAHEPDDGEQTGGYFAPDEEGY